MPFSVAIDGPSGAGKSTIARALAQKLHYLYIDTGALYRAIGLLAFRRGVSPADEAAVSRLLQEVDVSLAHSGGTQKTLLNGEDVSGEIRTHVISQFASDISALPAVRAFLLERQRVFARSQNVVMDGRDIGTVVLPDAQVKIFLTADAHDRAQRRYEELLARGQTVDFQTVLSDLEQRDKNDCERALAPLAPAHDAIRVNTTGNTWEQSFELIFKLVEEKLASCSTD